MKITEKKKQKTHAENTCRQIKKIFLELLKINPIEKITVTNLCQIVQINRSTFYQYYCDIYAVLEDIQQDFLQQVDELSEYIIKSEVAPEKVILTIQDYILKQKDLLYLLIFQYEYPEFEKNIHEKILRLFRIKVLQSYSVPAEVSSEELENILLFLTAGFYTVYKRWIQESHVNGEKTVPSQITGISQVCLDHLLEKKQN